MAADKSIAVVGYSEESQAVTAKAMLNAFELAPGKKLAIAFAPPE